MEHEQCTTDSSATIASSLNSTFRDRVKLLGTQIEIFDREAVVEAKVEAVSVTGLMTVMDTQGFFHLVDESPKEHKTKAAFTAVVSPKHKKIYGYRNNVSAA